jgi:hypothetical protein
METERKIMIVPTIKSMPPTIPFGWTLNKKQADLIKSLPKEELDKFEKQMVAAPMDATPEASKVRDNILKEAIKLAKKLKGSK